MKNKNIRQEVESFLLGHSDTKYQNFSKTLTPGAKNILGVRVPLIKQFAKELTRKNISCQDITFREDIFEEVLLEGFLIAYSKTTFETFVKEIKIFILKIDNWASCDLFCAALKRVKKHEDFFFGFLKPYLNSKKEFYVRFALVLLLDYYVQKKYLAFIFDTLDNFKHQGYYAKMAAAWLLSQCFIKYPKETFAYAKTSKLDTWTFKKGLEKTRQSFRVSEEFKKSLTALYR